jgi:hypothetical protein
VLENALDDRDIAGKRGIEQLITSEGRCGRWGMLRRSPGASFLSDAVATPMAAVSAAARPSRHLLSVI